MVRTDRNEQFLSAALLYYVRKAEQENSLTVCSSLELTH